MKDDINENTVYIDYTYSDDPYEVFIYSLFVKDENDDYERFVDSKDDFVGFDSVLDAVKYADGAGLEIGNTKEEIKIFMIDDTERLGDHLSDITKNAIQSLESLNNLILAGNIYESLKKAYSEIISEFYKNVNESRAFIEEEIADVWKGNNDYQEEPESYFDLSVSNAKQLIQHELEGGLDDRTIAEAYLEKYGNETGQYYEIVEDSYEYDDGLMIILYNATPDEVHEASKLELGSIEDTHFCINLESIYDEVPRDFLDKLYSSAEEGLEITKSHEKEAYVL